MAKKDLGMNPFVWILIVLLHKGVEGNNNEGYTVLPSYDLCNPNMPGYHPPTVYMGDVNVTTDVTVNWPAVNYTVTHNCFMLFKTCPSCQIKVETVDAFSYSSWCTYNLNVYSGNCVKNCFYFQLFDSDYKTQTALTFTKSDQLRDYSSQSGKLHVVACGNGISNQEVSIRLRLSVKKKLVVLNLDYWSRSQVFRSPFFPESYTLNDEEYKYEFRAKGRNSVVSVMFSDWLISRHSYIQFYNANIVGQISGDMRRPHIQSTGPNLTMIFNTGPARNTGILYGFRGVARFHASPDSIQNVVTDCDKVFTESGGTLQLDHLVTDSQSRDCIWVIKKQKNYEQIRINVVQLNLGTNGGEEVEIMEGLTSRGFRKLFADGAVLNSREEEKLTFDSSTGFYIHLQGRFYPADELVITYSSYYYGCPVYSAFMCDNELCIDKRLKCDGYDHCGDNSDEGRVLCGYHRDTSGDSSSSHQVSVGLIIPIVLSVVLVLAMCLVIIFIRRCRQLHNETYGSAPSRRQGGNSRGRHRRRRGRNVQMSVTVTSGEHPPSYNEVMQTSPIGQLNMAFSWSGAGSALTQPPSYEEAVGNACSELPAADMEQGRNAQAHHEESNERAIDVGPSEGLTSLLAPNSYVSSSSSSEDLSEGRMDILSSSDSSLDNNNSFASHRRGSESGTPAPQDSSVREEDNRVKEEGKRGAPVDSYVDIMSGPSPGFKMIKEYDTNESVYQEEEADVDNQQEDRVIPEPDRNVNNNDRTITTYEGKDEEEPQVHEQDAEARARPRETSLYRENERVGSQERLDPRHEIDAVEHVTPKRMYHDRENNGRYRSTEAVGGDGNNWRGSYTSPANVRSRSLADLSYGGSRGLSLVPGPEYSLSEMDKRFSYAGTGDTTFRSNRRDPYTAGTPIRDNLVENLHHFYPQRENVNGRNSMAPVSGGKNDQRRRMNGTDQVDRTHASHDNRNGNYSQRSRPSSMVDVSSLGTLPEMNLEEEDASSYRMKNHSKTHQQLQQEQMNRHGKPPNYKPRDKYSSPSSSSLPRDMGNGYRHSSEPSEFNENGARSLPRGQGGGHEDKRYRDHRPSSQSLGRTPPHPSGKNDFENHTGREHGSGAPSADRRPRSPPRNVPRSHPRSRHSSDLPTEPSPGRLADSNNATRPRPAPRRSVLNSRNADSNKHSPQRGVERHSTSAPLSVTNYVASPESGHAEVSSDDQDSRHPLAQLVFKTTNDDVFI